MGTFQRGINSILGEIAVATATAKRIGDKKAEEKAKLVKKSQAKPKKTVDMQQANRNTTDVISQKYKQKLIFVERKKQVEQRRPGTPKKEVK